MLTRSTGLTLQQQAAYRDRGYHFPVRALAADEAADLYSTFLDYCQRPGDWSKDSRPVATMR
jgi:hypothetical protein